MMTEFVSLKLIEFSSFTILSLKSGAKGRGTTLMKKILYTAYLEPVSLNCSLFETLQPFLVALFSSSFLARSHPSDITNSL